MYFVHQNVTLVKLFPWTMQGFWTCRVWPHRNPGRVVLLNSSEVYFVTVDLHDICHKHLFILLIKLCTTNNIIHVTFNNSFSLSSLKELTYLRIQHVVIAFDRHGHVYCNNFYIFFSKTAFIRTFCKCLYNRHTWVQKTVDFKNMKCCLNILYNLNAPILLWDLSGIISRPSLELFQLAILNRKGDFG